MTHPQPMLPVLACSAMLIMSTRLHLPATFHWRVDSRINRQRLALVEVLDLSQISLSSRQYSEPHRLGSKSRNRSNKFNNCSSNSNGSNKPSNNSSNKPSNYPNLPSLDNKPSNNLNLPSSDNLINLSLPPSDNIIPHQVSRLVQLHRQLHSQNSPLPKCTPFQMKMILRTCLPQVPLASSPRLSWLKLQLLFPTLFTENQRSQAMTSFIRL